MLDNDIVNNEKSENSDDGKTPSKDHFINLPENWWTSQNSYEHALRKPKPALHLLKPEQKSSITEYELPHVKGWNVKSGDYRVKVDEPERDYIKDKAKFNSRILIGAIIVTFILITLISMLASKIEVFK
ncbi:MAG: hypothetical protein Q8N03_00725 [Ignavibacteria bacterium]|jgi:hypothetical protein|nr:hypothetical protein [Ignavibacteria bacterium]